MPAHVPEIPGACSSSRAGRGAGLESIPAPFGVAQGRSRRLTRTFKGFQQVAKLFHGEPKGLEATGLDRVKQATEELRRMKAEFILMNGDFDAIVRKAARQVKVGTKR
ncbi:MAG TPA: hypothetical protein VNF29_02235 [Candidatus Binataceae bacterium]|nr:hypothetical protein [Candidatus Binataceae bacterium]